ncbi:lysine--tRNA ligase, partial [Candidatus Woesearchaeota archaeon]|nr:lysine--tRNA ligase [Candidatus Woesearchaeota archaeon]
MSEDNRLIQERKKKLADLRAAGVDPYPHIFRPKDRAAELQEHKLKPGEETKISASVAGRIMLFRRMGKIAFLNIQDESGRIQLFIALDNVGEEQYNMLKKLDMGDFIGAEGILIATKTGELSIKVKSLQLLCKSIRPMPEKHHGLKDKETRYRKRYLDFLVNPEVKEVFRKRAEIYKAIR